MPDTTTILDVITRVQTGAATTALKDLAGVATTSTSAVKTSFQGMTTSTSESTDRLVTAMNEVRQAVVSMNVNIMESTAKMGQSVRTSTTEASGALDHLRERARLTSQGLRVSAYESASAFGALGALLGLGLIGSYVEKLKDAVLETGHLAEATGMSIETVAEWHETLKASGVSTETFDRMLPRLANHLNEAESGSKHAKEGLAGLGITEKDLADKNFGLEQALDRIADHLHSTAAGGTNLGYVIQDLGRGSAQLSAVLSQGSVELAKQRQSHQAVASEMAKSFRSAQELTKAEEEVSSAAAQLMLPVFRDVVEGLKWVIAGFDLLGGAVRATFTMIGYDVQEGLTAVTGFGEAVADLATGHVFRAKQEAETTIQEIRQMSKDEAKQVAGDWQSAWQSAKSAVSTSPLPQESKTPPDKPKAPPGGPSQMEKWKAEIQQQIEDAGAADNEALEMERSFWEQKLATEKQGTKLYLETLRELSRVKHQLAREEYQEMVSGDHDVASLAAQGSAERVRLEQKTLDDVSKVHAAGTKEYEDQLKRVIAAQQSMMEASTRAEVESADRAAHEESAKSEDRVDIYSSEIAKLKGAQDAALSQAAAAEQRAATDTNAAEKQADEYKAESFRAYAEFVGKEIDGMREKFVLAQSEMERSTLDKTVESHVTGDDESMKETRTAYEEEKKEIQDLASVHAITSRQKIAMIEQIEAKQHAADMAAMNDEKEILEEAIAVGQFLGLDMSKMEQQYQQLLAKMRESNAQFNAQVRVANQQMVLTWVQEVTKGITQITTALQSGFNKWVQGQESFKRAMEQTWNELVMTALKGFENILINQIKHEAAALIVHRATKEAEVATDQAAATESMVIDSEATLKEIYHAAALAAAKAWQAVVGIPVIGPILAPIAAAASFAGVVAFASIASAEQGMEAPADMITQIHKNEMVLPAPISSGLKGMIASNNSSSSSSSRSGARVSVSYGDVHGGPKTKAMLDDHAYQIAAIVNRAIRNGQIQMGRR